MLKCKRGVENTKGINKISSRGKQITVFYSIVKMKKGNKKTKYKNATQGNEPISNSKPRQNPSDIRSSERIRYCRIAHDHDKYKGFAFGDAKIGDK